MTKTKIHQNRRDFIRKIVRGGLFGTFGILGVRLLKQNREAEGSCNFDFICQDCRKNIICQLPEASVFRLNKRKLAADE